MFCISEQTWNHLQSFTNQIISLQCCIRALLSRLLLRRLKVRNIVSNVIQRNAKSFLKLRNCKWLELVERSRPTCVCRVYPETVVEDLDKYVSSLELKIIKEKEMRKKNFQPLACFSWIWKNKLNCFISTLPKDLYVLIGSMIFFSDVIGVPYYNGGIKKLALLNVQKRISDFDEYVNRTNMIVISKKIRLEIIDCRCYDLICENRETKKEIDNIYNELDYVEDDIVDEMKRIGKLSCEVIQLEEDKGN